MGLQKTTGFANESWGLNFYPPAGAMLRLLPEEVFPLFERVSAAITVLAANRGPRPLRLLFMSSPAIKNLTSAVTIGLLVQDLVHRHNSTRALLNGDILVLTPSPRRSMTSLQRVRLDKIQITEIWQIETLSRYVRKKQTDKPKVYFANPGWAEIEDIGSLSAVIIEAFLPNILQRLAELLNKFQEVPFCILITPPLPADKWPTFGNQELIWFWDPVAKHGSYPAQRRLWICQEEELEEYLEKTEEWLWKCLKLFQGAFQPLKEAWGIYHQLRQLVVPVVDLEEVLRPTIRERIERLRKQVPPQADMELYWFSLITYLEKAYQYLQTLQEPPKFWVLCSRIEDLLLSGQVNTLRVVVPTWAHRRILMLWLLSLFGEQMIGKKVEVLTPRQEVRRIATGDICLTLLPGYRPAKYRFLDLYFPDDVEVIAYPYEAAGEQAFLSRAYADLERLQQAEFREAFFTQLGCEKILTIPPPTPQPAMIICEEEGVRRARKARVLHPSAGSVVEHLLESWEQDLEEGMNEEQTPNRPAETSTPEEILCIVLEDGRQLMYTPSQSVYVFYEAHDQVRRLRAIDLRHGARLVLLVDDVYEGLYERLLDALRNRMGHVDRLYLDLWQAAKDQLRKSCSSLRDLHAQLVQKGLSVQYPAFVAYFRHPELDEATLAPRREQDMIIMAKHSSLFPDERTIRETLRRIQKERKLRQQAGRALHKLLRGIVSGAGYREALQLAREISDEVFNIFSAVEVVTVRDVYKGRLNLSKGGI